MGMHCSEQVWVQLVVVLSVVLFGGGVPEEFEDELVGGGVGMRGLVQFKSHTCEQLYMGVVEHSWMG
jgi:hypothetical protein